MQPRALLRSPRLSSRTSRPGCRLADAANRAGRSRRTARLEFGRFPGNSVCDRIPQEVHDDGTVHPPLPDDVRTGSVFLLVAFAVAAVALLVAEPRAGTHADRARDRPSRRSPARPRSVTPSPGRRASWPPTPPATSTTGGAARLTAGSGAGNCEGIIDGPSNTYTLQPGDVGFTIRLQVKAFDGGGDKRSHRHLERHPEGHGTGRRPDEHRAADDHRHRRVGQTLTASRGELGEQVPRGLRQRLAPLRREREQLRADRRDGTTHTVGCRGQGLHPALRA